jgi:hypothetical protein
MSAAFDLSVRAAKEGFFDRTKVIDAVGVATATILRGMGFRIMTAARWSIRTSKSTSKPGQPPKSHRGTLKDLIFFSLETGNQNAVIGPTLSARPSGAPHVLEYSGDATLEYMWEATYKGGRKHKRLKKVAPYKKRIAARPFMNPALEKNRGRLAAAFENSIR